MHIFKKCPQLLQSASTKSYCYYRENLALRKQSEHTWAHLIASSIRVLASILIKIAFAIKSSLSLANHTVNWAMDIITVCVHSRSVSSPLINCFIKCYESTCTGIVKKLVALSQAPSAMLKYFIERANPGRVSSPSSLNRARDTLSLYDTRSPLKVP